MNLQGRARVGGTLKEFIRELETMLDGMRPPAIDDSSTGVRVESAGADVVVGQRLLRGLGVAIGIGSDRATVYWVDYSTLARSDEFDEARVDPSRVAGSFAGEGFVAATLAQVQQELNRSFVVDVRVRGGRIAELQVFLRPQGAGGSKIWHRRRRPRWAGLVSRGDDKRLEMSTSFSDDPAEIESMLRRYA